MSHQPTHDKLAQDIARAFGEEESIASFRTLIRRYPEDAVRQAYEETLSIPADKIRKSRGAIFNFLLKKYGRKQRLDN